MVTVTLVNKTLYVVGSDNTIIGQICESRIRAVRMYWVLAGRLDRKGLLSSKSCIE